MYTFGFIGTGNMGGALAKAAAKSTKNILLADHFAEKAEAFLRWVEETNHKMGIPNQFDVIQEQDIDQMIIWAKKEANPLYPVPVIWAEEDFRNLIESVRT